MKSQSQNSLIDFHTHIFPEKIASRALAALTAGIVREEGREIPPRGDGTADDLYRVMRRDGVSLAVVMPIATRPEQTDSILRFAASLNESPADDSAPRLISFASLHPAAPDALLRLETIAASGFVGIKLHPEFQEFHIDSPRSIAILRRAESLGLIVTVHAGRDIGMPPPVHCTPAALSHVLQHIRGDRLIAAHLGGFRMWDDVERYLIGSPILFDTAYLGEADGEPSDAQYLHIIRAHGSDKILFASDYPWKSPGEVLAFLRRLGKPGATDSKAPLTAAELGRITGANAQRLLDGSLIQTGNQ